MRARMGLRAAGLVLSATLCMIGAAGVGGCGRGGIARFMPGMTNNAFRVSSVVRQGVRVVAEGQARVTAGTFVVEALDSAGRVLSQASEHSPSPGQWVPFTAHLTLPAAAASTVRSLKFYEADPTSGTQQEVLTVPVPSTSR